MSHHSDDAMLIAGSDSFWEIGNYKRTTRRIEDGFRLCNDLIQLMQERSEIEKAYGKALRVWSKRWNEIIEKGPEYGTTEAAWKGVLVEADRRCELQMTIRDRLVSDVQSSIKQWQKDSYHKSMMQIKEKKELEDAFKKAQKPWGKLLTKVNKAKLDYHTACKNERTMVNQERNATSDTTLSQDQLKKLQERVHKCKEDVQKNKEKYEQSLQEINQYNAKYMEDMTVVFDKCQEIEDKRLKFFKELLFGIQDCLNVSTNEQLPQIYEEYRHTIQNADSSKDLKWWSNNHGVAMAMHWPQFEEYTGEMHSITNKKLSGFSSRENITLVNHTSGGNRQEYSSTNQLQTNDPGVPPKYPTESNKNGGSSQMTRAVSSSVVKTSSSNLNVSAKSEPAYNPFDEDDETETGVEPVKDSHKPVVITMSREADLNSSRASVASAPNYSSLERKNGISPSPDHDDASDFKHNSTKNYRNGAVGAGGDGGNPFDEDDWDDDGNDILVDNGEQGVPVKALYDYDGAESDELTFKQGEIFDKLEDEDEQGWCKGRKNGKVGLYPANYVQPVSSKN